MSFVPDPGQGGGFAKGIGEMIGTGGVSAKAVESAKAETQKLIDAAKSGKFKISPEGFQPLHDALDAMYQRLEGLSWDTYALSQAPKLGDHPYGHAVATHDRKAAQDESGSAGVVLEQLKEVLKQADAALKMAAGIHDKNEQNTVDTVSGIKGT